MAARQRCFVRHGKLGWATFSPCERYRYVLYRSDLDPYRDAAIRVNKRTGVFIMLNPSTADEDQNDPTIRRALGFLAAEGCHDAYLLNLFGYRATKPKDLAAQPDPIGPHWDYHVTKALKDGGDNALVVCAWGSFHLIGERGARTLELLNRLGLAPHALKMNGDGNPAHPLYLKKALRPFAI